MADRPARLALFGKIFPLLMIISVIVLGLYFVLKQGSWGNMLKTWQDSEELEIEAPDAVGITAFKEYEYIPAEKLPAVKAEGNYRWDDKERILRFSYNIWGGWLPLIAANHGTRPNPNSIFATKYGFQVDMVLMDDLAAAKKAFVDGEVHTLWGTVDMMVLLAPQLMRDSRTAPRIVQQVDWSTGGDGIVVRDSIRSLADLRNKTIALAENSPSEYFLNILLISAGLYPTDINVKYTATVFEAAAVFIADSRIDACVSWAPYIYKIPERVEGSRILSSTKEAKRFLADVYAVRADFARDHPDIVQGLIAGIFEGMEYIRESPDIPARWMADAFGMHPDEILSILGDAHPTDFSENLQFFLNAAGPANFDRTWRNESYLFRELRRIDAEIPFDQVMDFSFLRRLKKNGSFAQQKAGSFITSTPSGLRKISDEPPILARSVRISFSPNSINLYEKDRDEQGNTVSRKLYDPDVDATLDRIAKIAGQIDNAVILIEGHVDSSKKGIIPDQPVQALSVARAEAVRRALIEKFKMDPEIFRIRGKGWDVPADPNDPNNQALNRRVEISVYSRNRK